MNTSRRDFLVSLGAAGGLLATSQLPAFADDPALFPGRGIFERLSLTTHHIDAGAERPFSLLHISDTHLTEAYDHEGEKKLKLKAHRSKTFGGRQEEALRDSLDWAKRHVDYVLHTGDLIDFQSEANFDLVRKYYGIGGKTMFGSLGNHEYSRNMWLDGKIVEGEEYKNGTRELVAKAYPFDTSLQSTVVNGVNFVTFDNVYDTVTPEQIARFEKEFAKGLPTIICMHCPFPLPNILRASGKFWNSKNFKAIPSEGALSPRYKDAATKDFIHSLKSQPLLKGILCGHAHVGASDQFSPTAMQHVVAGNFLFHGAEITIA